MELNSPDWTNIGFSFILLTVNLFRHPTLIEHGLYQASALTHGHTDMPKPIFPFNFLKLGVYLLDFFCTAIQLYELLRPYLCFISFLYLDLYVLGDDAWIRYIEVFHANQTSMCLNPHLN